MADTPSACLLNPKREIGQIQREHRDNESSLFCRSFTLYTAQRRKKMRRHYFCVHAGFEKVHGHVNTHTHERRSACLCATRSERDRERKREKSLFNIYLLRLELVNRGREREKQVDKPQVRISTEVNDDWLRLSREASTLCMACFIINRPIDMQERRCFSVSDENKSR
jgi:hypothetical protein